MLVKKSVGYLFVLLCVLIAAQGCGRDAVEQKQTAPIVEKSDLTPRAEQWADSVCASMTLRQKVAQLFLPAIYAADDIWTLRLVREYADSLVGGVLLLKGNARNAAAIADSLGKYSRVPAFVSIDAEWGLAMRLADAPRFPANNAIDPRTDEQLMYDYGYELARECRLLGINVVLGPVVDVSVPNGFMQRRSFGDDPKRVADLSLAYARGLEAGNVVSVAKHFPGHGSVSVDSHRRKGVIERSLHEMDSIDLYPFHRWVEQRLSGVLVGHLAVPSIDSEMRPAAVSHAVITDLLRDDMKFGGLIFTDAINMKGAEGYTSVDAIAAGADIVVAPEKTFREIDRVVQAVADGRITEADIELHVKRILFYKYLLNFDADADSCRKSVEQFDTASTSGTVVKDSIDLSSTTADSIASELRHKMNQQ